MRTEDERRKTGPVWRWLGRAIARVRRIYLIRGLAAVGIVWILGVVAVMAVDSRIVIFDDRIRWAMTAGVWLLALVAAAGTIVRPLRRRLDFRRMAAILDSRHPEQEERLSTLVELSESDAAKAGFSASLFALVRKLAEGDVGKLDLRREFPVLGAWRRFGLFVLMALALAAGAVRSPNLVGRLFIRAVAPWSDIGNLFADEIAVRPGDITILSGSVIRIEAAPAKDVRRETEDGGFSIRISRKRPRGWSDETVEAMAGGVYETTADLNEREWRYRVTAGHAVTRYYYVRVSEMPKYELFTATVDYPAYTRMRPLVVSNADVAAITAVEGTRVKFDVRVSDPGTLADFRIAGEPLVEHTMVSNHTVNWSLDLVNADGFRAEKGRHPLTSVIDQPPTVVVEKPTGTLRLPPHAKIPVEITATDDIGIVDAYFRISVDDGPWECRHGNRISIAPSAFNSTLVRTVADIDLSLQNLLFARHVRFDVVVCDGCSAEYGGPHSATSAVFTVQFAPDESNYELRELREEVANAKRDIEEARKRLNDAQRLAREVRDELRRSEKASESTEQKGEKLAHELDEAGKRIEELRDDFLSDERFTPLTRPLERMLEEDVRPAQEQVENAQFRDREERADAVDAAIPQMEKTVRELDELTKRLTERAEKVDAFEKAKDLAARQDALAKAAEELTRERPLDTAKLEAWKRLEEAAMRKADELARQDPDSDISEAKRKMETAAREMARLKDELESAAAESNRLAKAIADETRQFQNQQTRQAQELAQAAADQQRALDALAQTNLAAAAQSQRAARNHLRGAEALPAVKALQDLASAATDNARQSHDPNSRTLEPANRPLFEQAQSLQRAAAEATKQEQALREALAKLPEANNPTNQALRQSLEDLDRKLRAELPKQQAGQAKALAKAADKVADLAKAAAAQRQAQDALDAVAAKRAEMAQERRRSDSPLDRQHQAALAEKAKAAAQAAKDAAAAQQQADELLRRGEATEGVKAMQQLADKAAAASQKTPNDIDRATRAAAAQRAASRALGEEKALREAMASGERTAADLEAFDRATRMAAKEQSAAFDRAEQAAAASDRRNDHQRNARSQDLGQAVNDQKRAAEAIKRKDLRRASEAQRAAEDRLERSETTEGVKALQQQATTATRNAGKSPQTKEKFDIAEAAQQAATEALQNELKIRDGIRKGDMTEQDLAAFNDQLKQGLLKMAGERTESAKAAAAEAIRKAKDVVGTEDDARLGPLTDAALEAARDAISSQLSESKLKDDDARAATLRTAEDAVDAILADAADLQSVEATIRGLQQSAAEALARNDRGRAQNLQKDIARAQARAADSVNEDEEKTARAAANAAQAAAAEAIDKAYHNWNDDTKAQAVAAQKAAMEKELYAQSEVRDIRALAKLSAAEKVVTSSFNPPIPQSSNHPITQSSNHPITQSHNPPLSRPAEAAEAASDAMDREVNAQATALGMSRRKADDGSAKGRGRETDSSAGGGLAEEVSDLASELRRHDSPDFLKSLFSRLGWFKIRGLSRDGLGTPDLKDVPREYRDLVRRYFLKLAEENP